MTPDTPAAAGSAKFAAAAGPAAAAIATVVATLAGARVGTAGGAVGAGVGVAVAAIGAPGTSGDPEGPDPDPPPPPHDEIHAAAKIERGASAARLRKFKPVLRHRTRDTAFLSSLVQQTSGSFRRLIFLCGDVAAQSLPVSQDRSPRPRIVVGRPGD